MVDAKTFRDAMSRLATAVNVITSNGPAGLGGCTASAVCSVSDAPPILLICINRNSRNNAIFKKNGQVCVNILRADQQEAATLFAQSLGQNLPSKRFNEADWLDEVSNLISPPMLKGALASLQCTIHSSAEVGSHTVFYCQVEQVQFGIQGDALVYFERGFHTLSAEDIC